MGEGQGEGKIKFMPNKQRCQWVGNNPLMIEYHDKELGLPLFDDKKIFEAIILDSFQAGLSWNTIMNKRENFRKAFTNFDVGKVAKFNDKKIHELMNDAGIIRNKLKINAAVTNAQLFITVQKEFGSFSNYIWQFVNHKPIINNRKHIKEVPSFTKESDTMSKDMKKRGFKFCGTTICYAFMQAVGMVNDHTVDCFRCKDVV